MNGYFKSCQRKIGVVTLMVACVLMAGWIRSLAKYDFLSIRFGEARYSIGSLAGEVKLIRSTQLSNDFVHWNTGALESIEWRNRWSNYEEIQRWDWDSGGLHLGVGTRFQCSTHVIAVSYWNLITPLTLFSAWLLLSKPRANKKPPTTPASENA
jgi:hypothetical protein